MFDFTMPKTSNSKSSYMEDEFLKNVRKEPKIYSKKQRSNFDDFEEMPDLFTNHFQEKSQQASQETSQHQSKKKSSHRPSRNTKDRSMTINQFSDINIGSDEESNIPYTKSDKVRNKSIQRSTKKQDPFDELPYQKPQKDTKNNETTFELNINSKFLYDFIIDRITEDQEISKRISKNKGRFKIKINGEKLLRNNDFVKLCDLEC